MDDLVPQRDLRDDTIHKGRGSRRHNKHQISSSGISSSESSEPSPKARTSKKKAWKNSSRKRDDSSESESRKPSGRRIDTSSAELLNSDRLNELLSLLVVGLNKNPQSKIDSSMAATHERKADTQVVENTNTSQGSIKPKKLRNYKNHADVEED